MPEAQDEPVVERKPGEPLGGLEVAPLRNLSSLPPPHSPTRPSTLRKRAMLYTSTKRPSRTA
ncbi:hypothetical protein VNPA141752_32530 [Pseudomonas aeruginosa]|nr:hypothetical protein VNPA141752_32530 [Pseudomonas aeruginosa]